MKNLLTLLERFSKSLNKDAWTRETISSVIKERVGFSPSLENLNLKDGVLEINAGAALKNEIKLKEEAIKSQLKEAYKISVSRILYK
jgi:hypothetical protein